MRPLFAILLLVGVVSTARAQEEIGLLAESSETSVWLRWTLPESVLPDTEFVIERTDEAGDVRTFAIPSPMPRSDAVGRGLIGDEEYTELVRTFARDDTVAVETREEREFNRAMLTLSSVTRPGWAVVLGTLYEDTTVTRGTSYVYRVTTTVDGAPVDVGEVEVTVGAAELLPTIGGLVAETDASGVNLRWELPEQGFVVAYRVYRTDPDETERVLAADGLFISAQENPETGAEVLPDVFLQDTAVAANTTYEYAVAGVNVFGRETARSERVSVFFPDPEPLEVPMVTGVDVRDRAIELFWTAPTDERVTGIGVLRYLDPQQEPTLLTPDFLPASATSYTDSLVSGGVSYYYSLVTVDRNGRQFGPSPPWATRGINLTPPSAPTNLNLTPTEESLELSWDAPPEDDVAGYHVFLIRQPEQRDDGADADVPVDDGTDDERLVLVTDDLIPETRHAFDVPAGTLDELTLAVRAVNTSFVEGPLSDPVSGRVIDVVPPAPPLLREIRASEGEISLTWAYTSDRDVARYRVLRRVQGEDGFSVAQESLTQGDTLFVDTAVTPGLLHAYTVEAIDASDNVSERAAPLAATPFRLTPPGPPRDLEVRAREDGGVDLRWGEPESGGVLFYVVERAAGNGRYVQVGDPLLAETRTFTDPTGRAGLTYRVYAIDTAGNAGRPSEPVLVRE